MASPRKSERLISSGGHGCFTITPPQLPATATRFPSHGSGRPGLVLQTATKLSSVGFEPTAVLTFGLRVRRLNHSATRSRPMILRHRTSIFNFDGEKSFFEQRLEIRLTPHVSGSVESYVFTVLVNLLDGNKLADKERNLSLPNLTNELNSC